VQNNSIDLYSDTHTEPSKAMRKAMANAVVGDEQQGADPTTNRLQEMVADLLGREAAMFLPSGTMCNQIAYRMWCQPGDEVIIEKTGHAIHSETGAPAALSGVMMRPIDGTNGIFNSIQMLEAIRPKYSRNSPRSALISIENTANFGGGTIWPIKQLKSVSNAAHKAGLKCHMDGARLFNAVIASGTPASRYGQSVDSLWIDLSKGLGCPIGAVLVGDKEFIEEAFRFKHQFGGAMRQSGIIAAAGIFALQNNLDRLEEDHENAQYLGQKLSELPGLRLDPDCIETNLVFFDVSATGKLSHHISKRLRELGVYIGATNDVRMRAVTHLGITRNMLKKAASIISKVLKE